MQQGWDIYLAGEKLCGKGPGASSELHMSEQGVTAKKANRVLGCIKECFSSRDKEIITQFCSVLSRLHLEIIFCTHYTKKEKSVNRLEKVQRRAKMIIQGLKSLPCEERLRELLCSALRRQGLGETLSA